MNDLDYIQCNVCVFVTEQANEARRCASFDKLGISEKWYLGEGQQGFQRGIQVCF